MAKLLVSRFAIVIVIALTNGCSSLTAHPETGVALGLPPTFDPPLLIDSTPINRPSVQEWWTQLQDSKLDNLIKSAVANNRDLNLAVARIAESRALVALADAESKPRLNLAGAVSRDRQSENGRFGRPPKNPVSERRLGIDLAWELDPFGAISHRSDEARANMQGSLAQRRWVEVNTVSEVASTYIELRGAQGRQAAVRELIEATRETMRLVDLRERAGLASRFDRLRTEEQLHLASAELPRLAAQEQISIRRLGVLVGGSSQRLLSELSSPQPLPRVNLSLPAAVPATLLDGRPDLVAARAQWTAAVARLGAARAARYPSFSLGSALGVLSISGGNLFDAASAARTIVAALRAPVYAPELVASIDVERAKVEQAALSYELTAVRAVFEVEQATVMLQQSENREMDLLKSVDAAQSVWNLSKVRYEQGLSDFLPVLDATSSRYRAELQLIEARAQTLTQFVALYRALGASRGREVSTVASLTPE